MINILTECPVFKGLGPVEIDKVLKSCPNQLRKFSKDELILSEGEETKNLMVVVKGNVRGEMIDFNGKTIKIEDVNSPRPIGLAFLFGKNNHMPVSVIANVEVEILFIPKESFLRIMQDNVQILNNVLNNISSRANFLSNKIKFLSFKTIKSKLAAYVLSQSKIKGDEFICSKTQKELADYFGVARPSVARGFAELEKEGILSLKSKKIKIFQKELLKNMV